MLADTLAPWWLLVAMGLVGAALIAWQAARR